jgi:hypothetical protein
MFTVQLSFSSVRHATHSGLGRAASAATRILKGIGAASVAGDGKHGKLLFHLWAVAVRAIRHRIVSGNDFFEGPLAFPADVFKYRHFLSPLCHFILIAMLELWGSRFFHPNRFSGV